MQKQRVLEKRKELFTKIIGVTQDIPLKDRLKESEFSASLKGKQALVDKSHVPLSKIEDSLKDNNVSQE